MFNKSGDSNNFRVRFWCSRGQEHQIHSKQRSSAMKPNVTKTCLLMCIYFEYASFFERSCSFSVLRIFFGIESHTYSCPGQKQVEIIRRMVSWIPRSNFMSRCCGCVGAANRKPQWPLAHGLISGTIFGALGTTFLFLAALDAGLKFERLSKSAGDPQRHHIIKTRERRGLKKDALDPR